MKPRAFTLRLISLCTLVLAGALCLSAQAPSGNFVAPRLKNGHPNLQGLWGGVARGGDRANDTGKPLFKELQYLPSAQPKRQEFYKMQGGDRSNDTLYFWCATASIPTAMIYIPFPVLIFQDDVNVVLLHEYAHDVRMIPTDRSPHPDRSKYSGMNGDSRGHWEGDTLVVDTTNFRKGLRQLNMIGDFLDENSHIIERFTLVGPDELRYDATIEDPGLLAKPWTLSDVLRRRPKTDWILDTACREGDQDAAALLAAEAAGHNK